MRRLLVLFVLFLTACGSTTVSGQYLVEADDGAIVVQLVETPDKRVTGTLDLHYINSAKAEHQQFVLEGSTDGTLVSVAATTNQLFSKPVGMSFKRDGDTLAFTGGLFSSSPVARRATSAKIAKAVERVSAAAAAQRQAAEEKQQAEQAHREADARENQRRAWFRHVDAVTRQVETDAGKLDQLGGKVDALAERYRSLTAKSVEKLNKARRAPPEDVSLFAHDVSLLRSDTELVESDVSSLQGDADFYTERVLSSLPNLLKDCRETAFQDEKERASCDRLSKASATFYAASDHLKGRFSAAAKVYREERSKQEAIEEQVAALPN
jgi:hypothetical protein